MDLVAQALPSGLFEMVFTIALLAGALLFVGAVISFAVFAYRSIKGEGMKDPRETASEKSNDDSSLEKGGEDDEWDYY